MEEDARVDYELGSNKTTRQLRKCLSIAGVCVGMVLAGVFVVRFTQNPLLRTQDVLVKQAILRMEDDGGNSLKKVAYPRDLEDSSINSLSALESSNTRYVHHGTRHRGLARRQLAPIQYKRRDAPQEDTSTLDRLETSSNFVPTGYVPSGNNTQPCNTIVLVQFGTSSKKGRRGLLRRGYPYEASGYHYWPPSNCTYNTIVFVGGRSKKASKKGRRKLTTNRRDPNEEIDYKIQATNYFHGMLDEPFLPRDPDDTEMMEGENPCNKVDPVNIGDNIENRKKCKSYLSLPYIIPNCTGKVENVPKIFHSVGRNISQLHHQLATAAANPDYFRHHLGDFEALKFIRERCGIEAAEAYLCLAPPAYRGDLFRFCALYSEGGIYLDEDIFPIYPLKDLYSPCSTATVGHDYPQSKPGKQMKILAGAPGAPIFRCALENIIEHVRKRAYPRGGPLELSGPLMLHQCYEKHSDDVAITYHDTRNAQYPFSGMRQGNTILAYEVPLEKRHMLQDPEDYAFLFYDRKVYRESCSLVPDDSFPSVAERVKYYMGSWYDNKILTVDSQDLCSSIGYYHPQNGRFGPEEEEALYLKPYLFTKGTLEKDAYFNSTVSHLVPWLAHGESDPLLLHYTEDTPNMMYPFPVITNSRSIEPAKNNPYYRLPLVAPLQADLQFGPLRQVQDYDIPWDKKKDSLLVWSEQEDEDEDQDEEEEFPDHLGSIPLLMKEQLAYKYVLSLEGEDIATELSWKLYSNSVVFMPLPKYVSWAMEDRLVPFYHYIPLKDDLSDLEEKIEWARKNDDKCTLIAQRATKYVEDLWMSEKAQSELGAILKTMVRRYQSRYAEFLSSCGRSALLNPE